MRANIKFGRPVVAAFGLAALLGAVPANAADVIGEEPPAPAAPIEDLPGVAAWAGPYVGVTAGYRKGNVHDEALDNDIDNDGFTGGAFAGVNGQSGRVVYGVEGDVNYSGADGENAGVAVRSRVDGSLRARLGYAVTDRVLVYGTGGAAAQRLRVSDAAGDDRNTQLGYTVGAGVDAKITEQVFGRLEYRYTDYGSDTYNTGSGAREVDSNDHRVQVGLGVKF
jgi:outer membrane immunogenic protein